MSIEERLRRALLEAVATEPEPARAPLGQVVRRRRRRPLAAVATALALLLVAAVALSEVRARDTRPVTPSPTVVPRDWKTFTDPGSNLGFRYPPDWVVRSEQAPLFLVVPREFANRSLATKLPFVTALQMAEVPYRSTPGEHVTAGRLPTGRAYVSWSEQVQERRYRYYSVDAGRFCLTVARRAECGAHGITVTIAGATRELWDRFLPAATAIAGTAAPPTATLPTTGDPSRPACRPDRWGLRFEGDWSFQGRSWLLQGNVSYPANGPACHLRATLRVEVEQPDGGRMAVPGTRSEVTVEGDLPEDRAPASRSMVETPLSWHWAWENWCRQPLGRTRVRVTAAGRSAVKEAPLAENYGNCKGIGRTAPWRIVPRP